MTLTTDARGDLPRDLRDAAITDALTALREIVNDRDADNSDRIYAANVLLDLEDDHR